MNKFSIVVPTLNSYKILKNLVSSIKAQTWQNWEVIFVDGSSNKRHINYLKELSNKDKRFSFYRQSSSNKGIFGAMNQGLEIIEKNSWLLFLGSDDTLSESCTLEKLNIKINSLGGKMIDLLVCKGKYFDIRKNIYSRESYFINKKGDYILNEGDYKKLIFKGFTPPHQATLFNGNSRIMCNRYNDNFKIAGDLEFFCRIANNDKLTILNSSLPIINISTGGISDLKHYLRIKEVIKCYLIYFRFRFILPFLFRYFNRLKQLK